MKKIFSFVCALISAISLNAESVTYKVTVPAGTNTCYIAGKCTGWDHKEMTKVDNTHYTITLETTEKDGYKYCSGPDWAYVELAADGKGVADRNYVAEDVVEKWSAVYDPSTLSYVDITISVKADVAPNIWWWGAGDKCPDANKTKDAEGNSYTWDNQPVMTAVADQTGWFEWVFKDVNASLGVTFKLNKGDKEIKATESTCYDVNGGVIECPATAISNTEVKAAYTKIIRDGQVLIVREGKTFDMMGQQVF